MRLARHGQPGYEQPIAATDDEVWHDLRPVTTDITATFLADSLPTLELDGLPVVPEVGRFGPPIAAVGKIVCIGLNYVDHANETGTSIPTEPIVFLKAPDTVVGPSDTVLIPRGSTKMDWEVELAIVIARTARYLAAPADAAAHIAGYAISNDVSERAFQFDRGGQWDKGKNCDTFNPLGPWITTTDDITDVQDLGLRTWINGVLRQDGDTKNMIFDVNHLVWYVSQFMTLHAGDVINTGTPHGVALGLPDQPYLQPGDIVELEIDHLGRQRQVLSPA